MIDKYAFYLADVGITWYALSYVIGFMLSWRYMHYVISKEQVLDKDAFEWFYPVLLLCIVFGGRLGQVVLYDPGYYFANPIEILNFRAGGMSFHGALFLSIVGGYIFAKKTKLSFLSMTDVCLRAAPIGIFLGRIANFINAEHYGVTTTLPWGMTFPGAGLELRHPSQLYEALLEGIVLFFLVNHKIVRGHRPGFHTAIFMLGYAIIRFLVEFVREPDSHLGFFFGYFTMGQLLCIPMLIIGYALAKRFK